MAQLPAGDVPLIPRWLRWRVPAPVSIDEATWQQVRQRCAWAAALEAERERTLRALTAQFLQRKTISPLAGLTLDAVQHAVLATLCCLPLLEFGAEGLRGWSQVLVYPDAFGVRRSHVDAAGVLHEWEDELIGESWDSGPLILSWADVQADLDDPHAGYCVAVHEMAHKLDVLDGALDGTPPLPRDWQRRWATDFQRSYDAFCKRVERGHASQIDAYAAEAPEEFFAVVSEFHFSAPERLQREMPEVAAHLARFYGRSPFAAA